MTEEIRQRQPREECPAFLRFVRRHACCACSRPAPSQAAHVSMASPEHGKRSTGFGEKASDRWAVPLCAGCHLDDDDAQHKGNERKFWKRVGVDPLKLACDLWAQFQRRQARSPEQRKAVLKRAKRILKRRRPMMEPGVEADLIVEAGVHRKLRKPSRARDPELYRYPWGRGQKIKSASRFPPRGARKLQGRPFA